MKISISKSLTYLALFCSIFYLQGCGDSNVEAVKGGVLFHYQDAKIGPVFEANFTNIRWSSSNKNGRNCVTFTGKITKATHEKMANLLDIKNSNHDFVFMKLFPDLYKNANEKLDKQFQGEADSLKKQSDELDELILKFRNQKSKLEEEEQTQKNEIQIEELEKKIAIARNDTWMELNNKTVNLRERQEKERAKLYGAIRSEIIGKYFWTEGDPVEIEFVVHPEANIEIKEMKGDSWNKFRLSMSDILDGIYK